MEFSKDWAGLPKMKILVDRVIGLDFFFATLIIATTLLRKDFMFWTISTARILKKIHVQANAPN